QRLGREDRIMRQDLRVDEAVAVVAVEAGVEPVERLVDFGPRPGLGGIGGRRREAREVAKDGGRLEEAESAVDERRHLAIGIDLRIPVGAVLARLQVDVDNLDRKLMVGEQQQDRSTDSRYRIAV